MKILYICPDTGIDVLGRKGASVHVRELIAAFDRLGHDVHLVAPRLVKDGKPPADVSAQVTRVRVPDEVQAVKHSLDAWTSPFVETSLSKDIRRMLYDAHLNAYLRREWGAAPPDLIYVRASALSTSGIELARSTGVPMVVELNAPLSDEQKRYRAGAVGDLYSASEGALLRAAAAVVVVSEALVEYVVGHGVSIQRVSVMPNGIDPLRFAPRRGPFASNADGPVIGFVGGLREWHGAELLPDVLRKVHRRHPGARLMIVGDGPLRSTIERRVDDLKITHFVDFLGSVDHQRVPDLISMFDVAMAPYPRLPHDFYFSPLKIFEYLGCGAPVVASRVGQIGELFDDGVEARLVEPGDVDAMATLCSDLLDAPELAREMGRRGSNLVHARHTWDRNASAVIELIGR